MTTVERDSPALPAADTPGGVARGIMRRVATASLATRLSESPNWPYASLVLAATDHAGRPLLLLSDLAVHTKALRADSRAALLFDGTGTLPNTPADPLTGARATVLGRVEAIEDETLLARFVARHPGAAEYAAFDDFQLYRMTPERAHLVAGFGRISWIESSALVFDTTQYSALAEAEAGIVEHMNADHAEAVESYATGLLRLDAGAWRMTGIDPEGCDLRCDGRLTRIDFAQRVDSPAAARAALVALAETARRSGAQGTA